MTPVNQNTMNRINKIWGTVMIMALAACGDNEKVQTPDARQELPQIKVAYTAMAGDSAATLVKSYTPQQQKIIMAVNRVDIDNLPKLDTVLLPNNLDGQVMQYLPFPQSVPYLKDIRKIIFFSYPTQTFAAYENGWLVYTGPTNMGREKDPTPTGLYYANWKAEETTSTVNDEWELKWNFNIANKEGVGWHQYSLPGYPASHSCLRMLEEDAKYMYDWAEQWELKGTDNVLAKGTPVFVFGSYPFGSAKPWWQLLNNPNALDISTSDLEAIVSPHLTEILKEQQNTESVKGAAKNE
jgi:hypothetical protein